MPHGCRHSRIARRVSCPSTVLRRDMSHSISTMRIFGSLIDRTSSSVSSSERPTLTITSSHTGRIDRMLASTGKSSLIAFLTMVNPDTLTTAAPGELGLHQSHPECGGRASWACHAAEEDA